LFAAQLGDDRSKGAEVGKEISSDAAGQVVEKIRLFLRS